MLQSRWRASAVPVAALEPSIHNIAAILNNLTLCSKHAAVNGKSLSNPSLTFVRYASHAAQGRANGPGDSAGRRLGAKKTAQQYVIPGNIIFKQRGTKWFPGENVGIGKDHTIYAMEKGYVRYYKNPALHPKRRYIGVALEQEGPGSKLPTPPNAPTRRRLGMYASPINKPLTDHQSFLESHLSDNSKGVKPVPASTLTPTSSPTPTPTPATVTSTPPTYRAGTYWPSNYEIGKAAERKGINVREYDRKDRWLAWRKRAKKVQTKILARAAKATRKTKGKKSNKGASTGSGRTRAG